MSSERSPEFRALEGRRVGMALTDGSRIDDCQLISAGRPGLASLWVFLNGADAFIPLSLVIEMWEVGAPRSPLCRGR